MPNSVTLTPCFESRYKRLAKKFASLEQEVDTLVAELTETPTLGKSMGAGLYKIRLSRVKARAKAVVSVSSAT